MHTDFFVPLNLTLPASVKSFFQEAYVDELKGKQSKRKQLGLFPLPASNEAIELKTLVDNFLLPLGLRSGAFGAFALNGSVRDTNVHVDAMKLNTRLSFYELAETPGQINWYADDGTGYEDWRPSYLGGEPILDYRYPWVDELQSKKRSWADCPTPVYSVTTSVPSAFIMTALPHNVVQGSGFRITVSCQVVDAETGSVEHTWAKVRSYFNSTVSPANAS
jgi:hypothetical protein